MTRFSVCVYFEDLFLLCVYAFLLRIGFWEIWPKFGLCFWLCTRFGVVKLFVRVANLLDMVINKTSYIIWSILMLLVEISVVVCVLCGNVCAFSCQKISCDNLE